jgi:hypothetical protein
MDFQDEFDFESEPEAPYQRHSDTSREAAEAIEPSAESYRGQVLAEIRGRGLRGATDDEIQVALGMNPSTERPRRVELWRASLVMPTRETRPTRSGRPATVWIDAKLWRKTA